MGISGMTDLFPISSVSRKITFTLSLIFSCAVVLPAFASKSWAAASFHIDYESGNISPQPGILAEKPKAADSINVDCGVARAGRCSLKTVLRRADSYISYGKHRAETDTMHEDSLLYSDGDAYRYGFSFMVDKNWQYDDRESIDIIWQFKRFDSEPDMLIALKGHDLVLRVLKSDQFIIMKDFQAGKWIDILLTVNWSIGSKGTVTVHLREEGEKSYLTVASFTGKNIFNTKPKFARPKWGLYKPAFEKSKSTNPRTIFHDEILIDKIN